jgi:nucleoside-diphosphate-sugar epimerase
MRVWVTGATGFVGGATVRRLLAGAHDVVAVARPSSAHAVDRARVTLAVADLAGLDALSALDAMARPDAIVHCAAEIFPGGPDAEARSRGVHVDGTAAVAARARRLGARFIHLSTTDVYVDETSARVIDEESPTGPRALYGRTKLEGELRVRAECPDAVILRPPGIYGPGSRGDHVQDVARKMLRRRFVFVGDGRARRSWIYVENLVDAIVLALDGRVPAGTYLVDDGAPVERRVLVGTIARALGMPAIFPRVPLPAARVIARVLERACPAVGVTPPLTMRGVRFLTEGFPLDTRRLRATGFRPSWKLDDAIDETVRWVRSL